MTRTFRDPQTLAPVLLRVDGGDDDFEDEDDDLDDEDDDEESDEDEEPWGDEADSGPEWQVTARLGLALSIV